MAGAHLGGSITDAALATLLLPFHGGALAWPAQGQVRFLRARAGADWQDLATAGMLCEQSFKPFAEQLQREGRNVATEADAPSMSASVLTLVLPPRQREEARALFARALSGTQAGGVVVACQANNEGARSGEADLARLAGATQSLSKNKCRVFWAVVDPARSDQELLTQWAQLDAPRPIADGRFLSRPGLFAWDRIDAASRLLAAQLPDDLAGQGADLGAGYGYLAAELLARCPKIVALDLYEAEARALDLARKNLVAAGDRVALDFFWHDVGVGLPRRYDVIVSNPPFHVDRSDRPELGQAFITAAADALRPGGRFFLVANRHLPYEEILGARFGTWRVLAQEQGFKVIEAIRADA